MFVAFCHKINASRMQTSVELYISINMNVTSHPYNMLNKLLFDLNPDVFWFECYCQQFLYISYAVHFKAHNINIYYKLTLYIHFDRPGDVLNIYY